MPLNIILLMALVGMDILITHCSSVWRWNVFLFICVFFGFFLFFFFMFFKKNFLLYNVVLVLPYINMHPPRVYTCSPSGTPLPPPSPYHPSGSSQGTIPKLPVSCIEPGLAIHFLYDIIHVLMPFSQIIPLQQVQKTVLYICVSFAVSHTGCRYHLSKFHIYALVYCIGIFLSGLLHSV